MYDFSGVIASWYYFTNYAYCSNLLWCVYFLISLFTFSPCKTRWANALLNFAVIVLALFAGDLVSFQAWGMRYKVENPQFTQGTLHTKQFVSVLVHLAISFNLSYFSEEAQHHNLQK